MTTSSKSEDNLWPHIKARLEEAIKPGWDDEAGRPLYPPAAQKADIRAALQRVESLEAKLAKVVEALERQSDPMTVRVSLAIAAAKGE